MKKLLKSWRFIIISVVFWFILSETISFTTLAEGFAAAIITYFAIILLFGEMSISRISYRIPIFSFIKLLLFLIFNIYKSSYKVLKIVLAETPVIKTVSLNTHCQNEWHRCLIGNCITLTPGTITIDLDKTDYLVLCMNPDSKNPDTLSRIILGDFEKALEG